MDELANGTEPTTWTDEAGDLTWSHPATLGLTAFVIAILALFGVGVFRGALYTSFLAGSHPERLGEFNGTPKLVVVSGLLVTAAFALLPLLLARSGLRRLVPSDGPLTANVLRAALLLSALSLGLHLLHALITFLNFDQSTSVFSYY